MFEAIHSKETIRQLGAVALTFLARQKFADDLKKKNKSYIFIYISIPINQKIYEKMKNKKFYYYTKKVAYQHEPLLQ